MPSYDSFTARKDLRLSGVCELFLPALVLNSLSIMKQWRIVVAEKENRDRRTEQRRYAMKTTMITGKIGDCRSCFRFFSFMQMR